MANIERFRNDEWMGTDRQKYDFISIFPWKKLENTEDLWKEKAARTET